MKELLLEKLETLRTLLTRVQAVKNFPTTEKALADTEKVVFKDAAIVLGDYAFTNEVYSIADDKITHTVDVLYLIKNEAAISDSSLNINTIVQSLRHFNFNQDLMILGSIKVSNQFMQLTDKIYYMRLEYSVIEFKRRKQV